MLALQGTNWLMGTSAYIHWQRQVGWVVAMAGFQLLKLVVAFIMIAVLLLMGKLRKDFFLTRGQLDAPIKSVTAENKPGKRPISGGVLLGLILGICIAPLTLLFLGLGNLPTSTILIKALPYFPAALLFVASNAFAEEMQFRASLLGDSQ